MQCVKCKYPESHVVYTRTVNNGKHIERRRECLKCGTRYTTREKLNEPNEKRIEIRE